MSARLVESTRTLLNPIPGAAPTLQVEFVLFVFIGLFFNYFYFLNSVVETPAFPD